MDISDHEESAEENSAPESIAWLTIRRTSPEDVKERELYVSLDGERIAILRFRDVVTRPIAPGAHELRVHNTLTRKKARFEASPELFTKARIIRPPGFDFGPNTGPPLRASPERGAQRRVEARGANPPDATGRA